MTTGEVNHTRDELREQIMDAVKRTELTRALRLHLQLMDFEISLLNKHVEDIHRELDNIRKHS